jgi:hypothetical protein
MAHAKAPTREEPKVLDGAIILDPQPNRFNGNFQTVTKIAHPEL